jgi:hypothetical protein
MSQSTDWYKFTDAFEGPITSILKVDGGSSYRTTSEHCYRTLHHITTVTVARILNDTQGYFDYFNKSLVHTIHRNELISHNTSQMQFTFQSLYPKQKKCSISP